MARVAERERSLERQKTLAVTIDRIRRSLDLETIFKTTTLEVRNLLNVERVAIYLLVHMLVENVSIAVDDRFIVVQVERWLLYVYLLNLKCSGTD